MQPIWQTLRNGKEWTKSREQKGNARARRLYEMLEKVTCEIDKIQKSSAAKLETNHLQRSATNFPESKSNFGKELGIDHDAMFPKRRVRINLETRFRNLRDMDTARIRKDTTKVRFHAPSTDEPSIENLFPSVNDKNPLSKRAERNERDIDNDYLTSNDTTFAKLRNNRDRNMNAAESTFADNSPKIKSSVERYLQNCTENSRDLPDDVEEKTTEPSADDIADILASYNIRSLGLYENFEGLADDYDTVDYCAGKGKENRSCSPIADSAQVITSIGNAGEEGGIHADRILRGSTKLHPNDRRMKAVDARSTGTMTRSDDADDDISFGKMEMNILNKGLSREKQSQVLQSRYLKKDLCLQFL